MRTFPFTKLVRFGRFCYALVDVDSLYSVATFQMKKCCVTLQTLLIIPTAGSRFLKGSSCIVAHLLTKNHSSLHVFQEIRSNIQAQGLFQKNTDQSSNHVCWGLKSHLFIFVRCVGGCSSTQIVRIYISVKMIPVIKMGWPSPKGVDRPWHMSSTAPPPRLDSTLSMLEMGTASEIRSELSTTSL